MYNKVRFSSKLKIKKHNSTHSSVSYCHESKILSRVISDFIRSTYHSWSEAQPLDIVSFIIIIDYLKHASTCDPSDQEDQSLLPLNTLPLDRIRPLFVLREQVRDVQQTQPHANRGVQIVPSHGQ